MKVKDFNTAKKRRIWLEKKLNISLKNIGSFSLDEEKIKNRNCENMIGAIQTPLGIAGPLIINHQSSIYLPLATTEGALVASVNRGCKVIGLSGGVSVWGENIGAARGPVFSVKNLNEGKKLIKWIKKNFKLIKKQTEKGENHLTLLKIEPALVGKNVYLRFVYDTAEAMGMNMATIATQKAVDLIEKRLAIKCLSLSGNFCVDKKPAWLNFILGRGKRVWAEAVIKKSVVKDVLKTTPLQIVEVVNKKCLLGSIMAGSLGFNAHYANIISALFLALGQDLAQIVEGSLGITTAEIEKNGNLYFAVYLPNLMVGTIGGGTHLKTQKEALSILGLDGEKKGDSLRLAEIIAGAVLAGELSLLAALAAGHLALAHQKLGRGNKSGIANFSSRSNNRRLKSASSKKEGNSEIYFAI